jgi:hypothetical protein
VTLSGLNEAKHVGIDSTLCDCILHNGNQAEIGLYRLTTASEDYSVACFETKRRRINGYVGASFINNCNHADRHSFAGYFQTVGGSEDFTRADGISKTH